MKNTNDNKVKNENKFMKAFKTKAGKVCKILFTKQEKEHSEKFNIVMDFMNKYGVLFHALLSLVLVFLIETISRRSFGSAVNFMRIHPLAYIYNSFIVFASLMVAFLFRRRAFMRVIISSFWIILGIVNGCILSNRVTPFTYNDLSCISDLMTMTNTNYFTASQATMVFIGAVIFIVLLVVLWIKGPRYTGKKHPVIVPAVVAFVLFIGIPVVTKTVTSTNVVDTYYGNIAQGYEDNGFIYSFSSTVIDRGMSKPDDYSQETVAEIINSVHAENIANVTVDTMAASTEEKKNPNIICILLESFSDPDEITSFTLNDDPIPYYHYLERTYSSGNLKVPVVGAGTANSEFEVLTGMSVQYFGTGELPYKTILKETDCESIASDLSKLGYGTHVVHNNGGNFYSRKNAFAMMGFDTFSSKECLYITDYTPNGNWPTDDILVDETIKSLDSTEGSDFTYVITVGTHGDYPTDPIIEDPAYVVSGIDDEGKTNAWNYYYNQLHQMDLFIRNLTEKLQERDEDTIVVMFGDHLPTMGLTDDDMVTNDIFQTEYVTWNNMGLEKKDADLYAYQLLAQTTDSVGIHEGTIFTYHQTMMNKLEADDYNAGLRTLQYDLLYGDRYAYSGTNPYPATDIQMGLDDVIIRNVSTYHSTGTLLISGQGFTPWTRIYVNGTRVNTTVISANAIRINLSDVEDGDSIVANICGSSNTIFRSSNEWTYVDTGAQNTESTEGTESTQETESAQ